MHAAMPSADVSVVLVGERSSLDTDGMDNVSYSAVISGRLMRAESSSRRFPDAVEQALKTNMQAMIGKGFEVFIGTFQCGDGRRRDGYGVADGSS